MHTALVKHTSRWVYLHVSRECKHLDQHAKWESLSSNVVGNRAVIWGSDGTESRVGKLGYYLISSPWVSTFLLLLSFFSLHTLGLAPVNSWGAQAVSLRLGQHHQSLSFWGFLKQATPWISSLQMNFMTLYTLCGHKSQSNMSSDKNIYSTGSISLENPGVRWILKG
jgi:hypothetical protein